ncbi:MAG: magnesium transporter [Bacteroidetes bacterium B1(2017)]|nr:MAG: magnesium transporter [Bacteroidetes bacterium B1(2017)]
MEKLQVDNALIKQFRSWFSHNDTVALREQLVQMYPPDIAAVIDRLDTDEARQVMNALAKEIVVKVLVEMEEQGRENFLSTFTPYDIANEFIENMDSDDAAYVLNHFPNAVKEEIISQLQDIEYASSLLNLISYEDETAGSLMAVELVKAYQNWTVAQCIEEIRLQAENVESIYIVYVTDEMERLVGLITLKNLILAQPSSNIADVYNKEVISVSTSTKIDEVANITKKYDLVVLPVVDPLGRLVGKITVDDVVDLIKEEADEDYQLMSGITEDVDSTDKVWVLSRARLPWLLIGLLGGIASSRILGMYEGQIMIHPEMAFFIPLIAAMGGNVGVQSSAIVVQGLANDTLGTRNIGQKILKEIRVALVNGIICSALILAYNLSVNHAYELAITVSIALITVIIFAAVFGTFIPMFLSRLKIDPAIATGPFITTSNDLLGIVIYFSIGRLLYNTL